jgi:universal stress protein E
VNIMSATEWRHILVAVRSPEQKRQIAIRKAAEIARRCRARVTLLHAYSMPYPLPSRIPVDSSDILEMVAADRRKQLELLARPLRATGIKVECQAVWDFPSAEAIVRHAVKHKPDLIVAESHRHSRVGRWFLANTDWELIREAPCPVWFVKHDRIPQQPTFLIAVDPTHARSKPTRLDDRLLGAATAAMQQLGGKAALVHAEDVMQVLPKGFMAEVMIPAAAVRAGERSRTAVRAAIGRLAARHGLHDAVQVVRPGLPAEVITAAAREVKADVLVMGVVSRRGLKRSFVGNTAEDVIDAANSDILVIKQAGFKTSVPRRGPSLRPAR